MNKKNIVVVGGGPAGMMAAVRAGQLGACVTLAEQNPAPGRKLLISGKGRCNLTNDCELSSFLSRFSKNAEFLRDAFKKFFVPDLIDFFKTRGLELKVERQNRVFPVTDDSCSVLDVLLKELEAHRVRIITACRVQDILLNGNQVSGVRVINQAVIPAESVILATGGISYKGTGSTGEGFTIIKRLGHHVTPLRPGLVPFETKEEFPKTLQGLTLKNITVTFGIEGKKVVSPVGELVFTDFGISGPLVLSLSARVVDWLVEKRGVYARIDLKPGLTKEQLDNRLNREFKAMARKSIKNVLKDLLPSSLIDVFLKLAGIGADIKANQVTRLQRLALVDLCKGLRLNITRARPFEQAMVTRGGVSLKEINPRTMESRLIKGLYFAGEMIDVDADTGGFNLQTAFSTGYLAGESAGLA